MNLSINSFKFFRTSSDTSTSSTSSSNSSTNTATTAKASSPPPTPPPTTTTTNNNNKSLVLQAPNLNEVLFFNESELTKTAQPFTMSFLNWQSMFFGRSTPAASPPVSSTTTTTTITTNTSSQHTNGSTSTSPTSPPPASAQSRLPLSPSISATLGGGGGGGDTTTPLPQSPSSSKIHLNPIIKKTHSNTPNGNGNGDASNSASPAKKKKRVNFPDDAHIKSDFNEPPAAHHRLHPHHLHHPQQQQQQPPQQQQQTNNTNNNNGCFSPPPPPVSSDLYQSYMMSCARQNCKPVLKLVHQLKSLQDCGLQVHEERVNALNLKSERLDANQMETLEEVFKRLAFNTIDMEGVQFADDTASSVLFEILEYYDPCERLVLANNRSSIGMLGWQYLAKYVRKSVWLEHLEVRGNVFHELIFFTHMARAIRMTQSLRVLHLSQANINGRYLLMLVAAFKGNTSLREVFLCENRMQPADGHAIANLVKESRTLESLDLRANNLQDQGLSHVCSGLSELASAEWGLRALSVAANNITHTGVSFLAKALIHNKSLTTLNIANNALHNEALYELKDALIVNKHMQSLCLSKVRINDEGIVAIAEYIAETQTLTRLDLRDNDIHLGGLMALASSIKFNKSLTSIDLDREPKKDNTVSYSTTSTLFDFVGSMISATTTTTLKCEYNFSLMNIH